VLNMLYNFKEITSQERKELYLLNPLRQPQ
ncbi:unnamed protein product, partial [marine sediment metagenome]